MPILLPDGTKKKIRLNRIQFEEDAGKLIHDPNGMTRVDFNRCGVPLLEIVSEPDMRSAAEAKAFLEALKELILYIGISDCRMEEGSLRCDVNVSVRPAGETAYGVRTEMKNLSSFKSIYRAIESESSRQMQVLETGGEIVPAIMRYDEAAGKAYPMRTKETAADYFFFPEPDLPVIILEEGWIDAIRKELPELPFARRQRLQTDYRLSAYDADVLISVRELADLFEDTVRLGTAPKTAANYIMSDVMRLLNERGMEAKQIPFGAAQVHALISMVEKGEINRPAGAKVMEYLFDGEKDPEKIVQNHGLSQVSDIDALNRLCCGAIEALPKAVEDYRKGKKKAITSLVGEVMRSSRGKANPAMVNTLLQKLLDEQEEI